MAGPHLRGRWIHHWRSVRGLVVDILAAAAQVLEGDADREFAALKTAYADEMLEAFRDRDKVAGMGLAFGVTARFAALVAKFYSRQSETRAAALERRVAQLEQQLGEGAPLKYAGVYQRSLSYLQGAVVTMNGSAWVALKDVPADSQPGAGGIWQLMVKHGRDAK